MQIKVYLRSPPKVLAPDLPAELRDGLPDVELPEGSTVETLLRRVGASGARPLVLVNKVRCAQDALLHDGDRVDLVLPLGGG
jgi:sulfur carrier protein ThiS